VGSSDLEKAISAGRETLVGHLGVRFPAGVLFPALVALLWFHSSQKARFRLGFVVPFQPESEIFGSGLMVLFLRWLFFALLRLAFQPPAARR
jgi:hypothetical protein